MHMTSRTRRRTSKRRPARPNLRALTVAEKAALLDSLLAADGELRARAEALAEEQLQQVDRVVIADEVAWNLQTLSHELIDGRAGRQPGIGYVEPTEAAWELLDEECEPFLEDLARRVDTGHATAGREIGLGLLAGLYECRGFSKDGAVLSWAEDFPAEHAGAVVDRMRRLGIGPTPEEVEQVAPDWQGHLVRR